ncbi:MAG: nucleotide sugar dehydrogenase [Acidimicrobiales bacterium]
MKVAIFGLGYVGIVTAACLARDGHDVWGVDVDVHKVLTVAGGHSPVMEPGLDDLVAAMVAAERLHATESPVVALDGAAVSLVCVGTPSAPNGSTDLSYICRATEDIVTALGRQSSATQHVVAVRSTVPPGTVDNLVAPALKEAGLDVGTAMCPEFLREGSGLADFLDPPLTVIGASDPDVAETLTGLLGRQGQPSHVVTTETAEALKYACNAFHATKITFANEMARVLRPFGIDSREVMQLFCQDTRLNVSSTYLRPGFAFGGPCLGKDLRELLHLARMSSVDLPLLSGVLASNDICVTDVVHRVTSGEGMAVALLGLSFKASSDDLRESPSVAVAEALVGKGYELRIHDPVVNPSKLIGTNRSYVESRLPHLGRLLSDTAAEAVAGVDVAVVCSSVPEVVAALTSHPPARILDLCGTLGPAVEALPGYEGVGW